MNNLTKTEQYIIKNMANEQQIQKTVLLNIYNAFRNGADLPKDAPQYVNDLWREAQERVNL